jgi:hypothetical protein
MGSVTRRDKTLGEYMIYIYLTPAQLSQGILTVTTAGNDVVSISKLRDDGTHLVTVLPRRVHEYCSGDA